MKYPNYFNLIRQSLISIINNDYVLLDVPHYGNAGDVLIWQATEDILQAFNYKCIYSASISTYSFHKLPEDTIIIFIGGGNFGDLWRRHQDFRHKVLLDYPNNPIVQLPQSVYFESTAYLEDDIKIFNSHFGTITLFARDASSFDFFKNHYPNCHSDLLPDMVLAFDLDSYIKKYAIKLPPLSTKTLVVKRKDNESSDYSVLRKLSNVEIADWPSLNQTYVSQKILYIFLSVLQNVIPQNIKKSMINYYYKNVYKKHVIKSSIIFIASYTKIISTRLHALILADLLGKEYYYLDNSYGKLSGVYNCWINKKNNRELK